VQGKMILSERERESARERGLEKGTREACPLAECKCRARCFYQRERERKRAGKRNKRSLPFGRVQVQGKMLSSERDRARKRAEKETREAVIPAYKSDYCCLSYQIVEGMLPIFLGALRFEGSAFSPDRGAGDTDCAMTPYVPCSTCRLLQALQWPIQPIRRTTLWASLPLNANPVAA
jgi:hypothetical protein